MAPYSPYILRGNTVYVSGNCGNDPATQTLGTGTVADRTRFAMGNIEALLREVEMELTDIVSVTIYLSKYEQDLKLMNEAYLAAFPEGHALPARACIGVAVLPRGTDVEISVIAVRS